LRARITRFSRERSLGAMATAIAHEINQPLIAIQNYAQAAKRRLEGGTDDRPKLMELFSKVEGQAERAGAITQRVRSLVSASDLRRTPVAILPLLDEVIRIMQPEAEARGCHITREHAAGLPEVLADALQVQLVLVNLLRNAVHYDKRVSIDVRLLERGVVQISVTDRGPGVPPDRVADIFEPLSSGTKDGMGIGLSVSREIVEAHGGRLWHEPHPEGGAIFRFTLQTAGS
jgi:two-component system sensor kinase FixL